MDSTIRTVPAAVRAAARAFGDTAAVAEPGGQVLSYRDLHDRVREVAGALIAGGIEPGDRVALWSPNTHHWVLAGLGALYAGATLVPVNTRFTGPEALDVVGRSQARALFVAGPFLGADRHALLAAAAAEAGAGTCQPALTVQIPVESAIPPASAAGQGPAAGQSPAADQSQAAPGWTEFLAGAARIPDSAADERAAAVTADTVSDILFTSGTTGRSKGAMSAHRQALDVARAWAGCAELTSADRYLIVNPFFHSFGYKAGILACLLTGATIVPQRTFDAGAAGHLHLDPGSSGPGPP